MDTESCLLAFPTTPAGPCLRGRPSTSTYGGSSVSRAKTVHASPHAHPTCGTGVHADVETRPFCADRDPQAVTFPHAVGLASSLRPLLPGGLPDTATVTFRRQATRYGAAQRHPAPKTGHACRFSSVTLTPALGSLVSEKGHITHVAAQPLKVPDGAGSRLVGTLHTACALGPHPARRLLGVLSFLRSGAPRGSPWLGFEGGPPAPPRPASAPVVSFSMAARSLACHPLSGSDRSSLRVRAAPGGEGRGRPL